MSDLEPPSARRDRYYADAHDWASDTYGSMRASRRVAWWVAAGTTVIAVAEALAIAAMAPLKTVVPYTISVDRQTGYVETVRPLAPGVLNQDTAVTQSYIVQYVLARETFDATDLREAYRKVLLLSAGDAKAQYVNLMKKATPQSPLNTYGPQSLVQTTIKSVSLLTPTTALVRFDTTRQENGHDVGAPEPWVAAIAFRYTAAPISMGDRFVNPLGFQVTRYRRDAESAPGLAAPLPMAPAPTNSLLGR